MESQCVPPVWWLIKESFVLGRRKAVRFMPAKALVRLCLRNAAHDFDESLLIVVSLAGHGPHAWRRGAEEADLGKESSTKKVCQRFRKQRVAIGNAVVRLTHRGVSRVWHFSLMIVRLP